MKISAQCGLFHDGVGIGAYTAPTNRLIVSDKQESIWNLLWLHGTTPARSGTEEYYTPLPNSPARIAHVLAKCLTRYLPNINPVHYYTNLVLRLNSS
jgi:hypothetical protein